MKSKKEKKTKKKLRSSPRRDTPILVSACLVGLNTRYDGTNKKDSKLIKALKNLPFIPVCPEQLGGLPTPRPPSSFWNGDGEGVLQGRAKLINQEGCDVTENFIRGAKETEKIVDRLNIKFAIFKDRSPSCGVEYIISDKKQPIRGCGVTTALLKKKGLKIFSEKQWKKFLKTVLL